MMTSLAGSSIDRHIKILRGVGFLRASSSNSTFVKTLHEAYRVVVITTISLYMTQQLMYAYQYHNNLEELARVLFLFLCHITSLAKQIVLHTDADRIDHMIEGLDGPLFNPSDSFSRYQLQTTAKRARLLVTAFPGTAVITCMLWVVFPVVQHVRGLEVELALWTNLDYKKTISFWMIILYSYLVTSTIGIANTTMDAFMGTILYQNKTQLTILRNALENLGETADEESARTHEPREDVLMRIFLRCLAHYRQIIESTTLLQSIFGTAILIQFAIGGWILCMAVYQAVSLNVLSTDFISMILFTTCILTELFLYCYFGNEVTVESEYLATSMYQLRWYDAGKEFRKALILAMERTKRTISLTAGGVVPLSLNTFIQILRSAYTFYTVLRQTKT